MTQRRMTLKAHEKRAMNWFGLIMETSLLARRHKSQSEVHIA